MDDLDDLQACEFVTDTEDQDSLDERIESEQRLWNQQLWASFQNAACSITKLYKDRTQPNISPWVPFQNAASNLTTLYKDCIESQKRFAKVGYQVGRRRRMRELKKLIKKHKLPNSKQAFATTEYSSNTSEQLATSIKDSLLADERARSDSQLELQQLHNNNNNSNVASILAVNQLNLSCDAEMSMNSHLQAQPSHHTQLPSHNNHQHHTVGTPSLVAANQQQAPAVNNEDDLATFQQALAQPTVRGIKTASQQQQPTRRINSNNTTTNRTSLIDPKSEEDRLCELNQFLAEEYHRHVGSRKRSCSSFGGAPIKRFRD